MPPRDRLRTRFDSVYSRSNLENFLWRTTQCAYILWAVNFDRAQLVVLIHDRASIFFSRCTIELFCFKFRHVHNFMVFTHDNIFNWTWKFIFFMSRTICNCLLVTFLTLLTWKSNFNHVPHFASVWLWWIFFYYFFKRHVHIWQCLLATNFVVWLESPDFFLFARHVHHLAVSARDKFCLTWKCFFFVLCLTWKPNVT